MINVPPVLQPREMKNIAVLDIREHDRHFLTTHTWCKLGGVCWTLPRHVVSGPRRSTYIYVHHPWIRNSQKSHVFYHLNCFQIFWHLRTCGCSNSQPFCCHQQVEKSITFNKRTLVYRLFMKPQTVSVLFWRQITGNPERFEVWHLICCSASLFVTWSLSLKSVWSWWETTGTLGYARLFGSLSCRDYDNSFSQTQDVAVISVGKTKNGNMCLANHGKNINNHIYIYIWGFPEIGVPPNHPF